MRLLFVSNFYPPHDLGGYEKHCQEVTDGLQARGHRVRVLTSRHGVRAVGQEGHIRRVLYLESDLRHYDPVRFFLHRGREERDNASALQSAVAGLVPDAILFWGMWNLSRWLPAVAESTGLPVAYWLEDLWPLESDLHTRYWRSSANSRAGRYLMGWGSRVALGRLAAEGYPPTLQFSHVACGSQFLKRKLAAELPAFRGATVVRCGIELGMFQECQPREHLLDPKRPRIVYVGSLGRHKGVHTAVAALSRVRDQAPGLRPTLTLVGSGHPDYVARLQQLAEECGVAARVHFTGTVAKEKVPSLLAAHDILVMPSVCEEAFGRVVVEGMAAGLVVVGTATGGSGEILVDGVNGLIFTLEDADGLAECLLRLACDPALYARLAREGKRTSERFDLNDMVDGIEHFLSRVAASGDEGRAA